MWKNDKEIMIAKQKERAIAHWQEAVKTNDKLLKMNASIVEHLNKGLVPPAFHAFSAIETDYLFPVGTRVSIDDTNSDEIQLSANPVSARKSFTGKKRKSQISFEEEMSYLLYFFDEKSGKALPTVHDSEFLESWEFSTKYTQTVTDLVNAPATMVGEDVEVTKLTKLFSEIRSIKIGSKDVMNLITRSLSRGVVADCFKNSEPESTYAIVGNPGIGKSWTLLYALQQALLYENACVVFLSQKAKRALVCIRRKDKIYVWQADRDHYKSRLFRNSNVLVLVDPSEKEGASIIPDKRRLIYAASNNEKHFDDKIFKVTGKFARTLSPYKDKELVVAIPYMVNSNGTCDVESMEVMLQRRKIVGNLPRYLISKNIFEDRRDTSATVENDAQLRYLFSYFDGLSDNRGNRYKSIQERLFSVWANSSSNDNGYDGQINVRYEKRIIRLMNQYVKDDIVTSCWTFLVRFCLLT